MSDPLFSPHWYRVASLRPRLRSHTRIHRHQYRGRTWFVLEDLSNGRFQRFRPQVYRAIGLMDGRRTVDRIWQLAAEELAEDAPTQDDMIRLLAQLHAADLLQTDVSPDASELFWRYERQRVGRRFGRALNPLAVQIPLLDPERFLSRTLPWVRPLLSRGGAVLWLAAVLSAGTLALLRFDELTGGLLDRVFAAQNLVAMALVFPLVKALHELGHAYATRALGGEVHEMGIMFLVGMPVPYVDASSATAFARRGQRVAVGAAGMVVEVFVAALALVVWAALEPGLARSVALNVVVIAGVTTLGFNANPLLRFDGYYMLSDWLEIPNLRQRANACVGRLFERYLLGREDETSEEVEPRERAWLVSYAVSAFLYRGLVLFAIAWWVLDANLVLGTLVLGVAAVGWLGIPAWKAGRFLLLSPRLRRSRGRALALSAAALMAVVVSLFAVPLPLRTRAEGVIWIPEDARVRAATDGFIREVVARPGQRVEPGDVLVRCEDPDLASQTRVLAALVRELEARRHAVRHEDPVATGFIDEELRYARERLARSREREAGLVIESTRSGTFVAPFADRMPGRFVHQGEALADVVDLDVVTVRATVEQRNVELVRERLSGVDARLAESMAETVPARVLRVAPAASDRLPAAALGTRGGGDVATDPRSEDAQRALQSFFEVELELPATAGVLNVGGRVYLRFQHGSEPLATQWARRLRQLFLSRLDV